MLVLKKTGNVRFKIRYKKVLKLKKNYVLSWLRLATLARNVFFITALIVHIPIRAKFLTCSFFSNRRLVV